MVCGGGLVHARVGQIVLKCNVFKTIFVRPTESRVEGHARQLAEATADLCLLSYKIYITSGTLPACYETAITKAGGGSTAAGWLARDSSLW